MRRIIFGAIWLTGFLAVLLSWALIQPTKAEQATKLIIMVSHNNHCRLEVRVPETDFRRVLGETTEGCFLAPIGWSHGWFYYQWNGLERIDQRAYRQEIVIENWGAYPPWLFLSPDGHYLIEASQNPGGPWEVSTTNLIDGKKQPMAYGFDVSLTDRMFSPNGEWLIVYAYKSGSRSFNTFLVSVDSDELLDLYLPYTEYLQPAGLVHWTDSPEWWIARYSYSPDGVHYVNQLYKMRPLGKEFTLLASSDKGPFFSGWVHPSGLIGLQTDDVFTALDIDTGEMLWQLEGVETVLTDGHFLTDETLLAEDWVHFKMTDGRLARCKIDGSELAFYDTQHLDLWDVWGWSNDGEWVWLPTHASNPELVDVVRIQRDTGKIELMFDERYLRFEGQSPDGEWLYYQDEEGNLIRINLTGQPKSQIIVPIEEGLASILTWTPPYQAKWQPTHTLAIGIGLMSLSTLTPIVLWRRRDKPRTA